MGADPVARRCSHREPANPADPPGPRRDHTPRGLALSSPDAGLLALPGPGGHDPVHGRIAGA